MFAVKDLESLKNLAAILTIPLLAAAYVADGALETVRDPVLDWLRDNPVGWLQVGGWLLWFMIVVAVVGLVLAAADWCVTWVHTYLGDTLVMPLVGFACLTAGLMVFGHVFDGLPRSPLNPLWHLGLLAYGFTLVDRSATAPTPRK